MTRPIYEQDHDIANEIAFMRRAESSGIVAHQLKKCYPCDFYFKKGDRSALVEYRRRNVKKDTYPDIFISAYKYSILKPMAQSLGVRFLFYVEFNDGLFVADLTHFEVTPNDIKIGGRTDRGDRQDIEPLIAIPIDEFKSQ